jgi:hypothetical protein
MLKTENLLEVAKFLPLAIFNFIFSSLAGSRKDKRMILLLLCEYKLNVHFSFLTFLLFFFPGNGKKSKMFSVRLEPKELLVRPFIQRISQDLRKANPFFLEQ